VTGRPHAGRRFTSELITGVETATANRHVPRPPCVAQAPVLRVPLADGTLVWGTIGIALAGAYFVYLFRSTRGKIDVNAEGHGYH
jgi:hypothetical protein